MPDIVITEFMDEEPVEDLKAAGFSIHWDKTLCEKPDELKALIPDAVALIVRNRTPVNGQCVYKAAADDVVGAMAEAAVAKALGVYWLGEWLNHKALDVGDYQVRHTKHPNGRLLLQPGDADEQYFVLVTGLPPAFTIRGAIDACQGKTTEFWDTSMERPCYAVPQHKLKEFP